MPTSSSGSHSTAGVPEERISRRGLIRSAMPALVVAAVPVAHAPATAADAPFDQRNRAASVDDDSVTGPVDSINVEQSTVTLGTAVGGQVLVQCDGDTVIWSDTFVTLDQLRRYQMVIATGRFRGDAFHATVIEAIYRGVDIAIDGVSDSGIVFTDAGAVALTQHTRNERTDRRPALASVRSKRRMRALVRDDPLSGTMIAFRILD